MKNGKMAGKPKHSKAAMPSQPKNTPGPKSGTGNKGVSGKHYAPKGK